MTQSFSRLILGAVFILGSCATIEPTMGAEQTMCQTHEEVYFSCLTGKKIVSVCASGNISPNNGYVQYRIGIPGKIDLEYPKLPDPPIGRFSISDISGGNLNIRHIKFNSGSYNYVIYQGDTSGVYVKQSGRTIANLTCQPGDYQAISPRALRGIKTVDPVDGVD